ncbi:MAG TPA: hypothetical protein VG708_04340 [Mycobacteriales bacterium]|nr:hypothetical protein [Mycobacteriales bacterium]
MSAPAVAAVPRGAPTVVMHVAGYSGVVVTGPNGGSEWTNCGAGGCVTAVGDSIGVFPKPYLVATGKQHIRIALRRASRPTAVRLAVFRHVSGNGQAAGHASHPQVRLVKPGGHGGWRAAFRLAMPRGADRYLRFTAHWRYGHRANGHGSYLFHLRGATG